MRERIIWADNIDTEIPDDFAYSEMLREMSCVPIFHPVIVIGTAGLWNGAKPVSAIIYPDTVADIVSRNPWNGMDSSKWSIDERGDLRYRGTHHDGVNTVIFRELKSNRISDLSQGKETLRHKSLGLGRRIRRVALR
jgi:hypothetical protein